MTLAFLVYSVKFKTPAVYTFIVSVLIEQELQFHCELSLTVGTEFNTAYFRANLKNIFIV